MAYGGKWAVSPTLPSAYGHQKGIDQSFFYSKHQFLSTFGSEIND